MPATKLSISVPADLAEEVRAYDIPLSATCQRALRAAIDEAEGDRRRIIVPTLNGREGFEGRWVLRPDSDEALPTVTHDPETGERLWESIHWGVALTARGRIAVYQPEKQHLVMWRTLPEAALPPDVQERVEAAVNQPDDAPIIWHGDW